VSGGFCPSILSAIRQASIASKVVAMQSPSPPSADTVGVRSAHGHAPLAARQLPVSALLHLATLGGAEVCCLDDRVGSFAPGKSFDALLVSVRHGQGNPGIWGVGDGTEATTGRRSKEALEAMLESFLFCGDDRNIRRVYVQGKMIGGCDFGEQNSRIPSLFTVDGEALG
jgi:guanine deaminase